MTADLTLGGWRGEERDVQLPASALLRHVMALGSSGSGKTVFCKVVVEEVLRAGLPAICIDPQGDLCSLATVGDPEAIAARGLDPRLVAELRDRIDPVIFTPASRRGVPLCADPVERGLDQLEPADRMHAFSRMAAMIVNLLGYDPESDDGAGLSAVLDTLLGDLAAAGHPAESLSALADRLARLDAHQRERFERLLDAKKLRTACQRLARLDVGARRLLFHEGLPIDVDLLLGRAPGSEPPPGKVRLSIVYLNTLHQQDDKDFFVAALASRIYGWMLAHPSDEPQLLFYLDEVAPFVPPVRKPAAKDPLVLLFKQARKYGVCCLMATQNPGDVDYKAMAQFGTWALGRMTTRQDLNKLAPTIKSLAPTSSDEVLATLPALRPGHFVLLSPDHFELPCPLAVRWLLTRHETYDEDRIAELTDAGWRERFAELETKPTTAVAEPGAGAEAGKDTDAEADGEIRPSPSPRPRGGQAKRGDARAVGGDEPAQARQASQPAPARSSASLPARRRPVVRTVPLPAVPDARPPRTEPMPVAPTVPMPVTPAGLPPVADPRPAARPGPGPAPGVREPSPPPQRSASGAPVLVSPAPTPPVLPATTAGSPAIAAPAPPELGVAAPLPRTDSGRGVPADPARAALESHAARLASRPAMSTADFARVAGCGEAKARRLLKALVEVGLARAFRRERTVMYWAVATGARPDLGLEGRVAAVVPKIGEREARQLAVEHARGKLLGLVGQGETFERAELRHRLVYRLDFEERVERPVFGGLLGKRSDQLLGSVYVHPRTLQLLVLAPQAGILFADRPAEHASDVADLDGVARWVEVAPGELSIEESDLTVRREPSEVKSEIEQRYAVVVGSVTPAFVPVWRLVLRKGAGAGYRVVPIDAVTGRAVTWP